MSSENQVTRRKFIADSTKLIVAVTSFSVLPGSCGGDRESGNRSQAEIEIKNGRIILDLNIPAYKPLDRPGGGVYLEIPSEPKPIIVTRVSKDEVAAFSSQCPHAGYRVLLPENGILVCESGHGGVFDLKGNVIKDPPKSRLAPFEAKLNNGTVTIAYAG